MTERTAVYHLYDADNVLIYVGVTKNIEQRWWQHSKLRPWWCQVVRREVAWLDSRPDALLTERRTVIAVLRNSRLPAPESEAVQCRRQAVIFAARVGWSKHMIAAELGIAPDDADAIIKAARRDGHE